MDDYWNTRRFSNYYQVMANLEANQLFSKATEVSLFHLKDGFTRITFQDDIKRIIDTQLGIISSPASTEEQCRNCMITLKEERESLSIQDQMIRSGQAYLVASVEFIKDDKTWHWVINGVGVVLGILQVIGGIGVTEKSFEAGNV